MRIVVLAGGTSTERDVSIVSGAGICNGLRAKGHKAVLIDVFCGINQVNWEDPFPEEYDVEAAADYIRSFNKDIETLKKERREFFGPNVLESVSYTHLRPALWQSDETVWKFLHKPHQDVW